MPPILHQPHPKCHNYVQFLSPSQSGREFPTSHLPKAGSPTAFAIVASLKLLRLIQAPANKKRDSRTPQTQSSLSSLVFIGYGSDSSAMTTIFSV